MISPVSCGIFQSLFVIHVQVKLIYQAGIHWLHIVTWNESGRLGFVFWGFFFKFFGGFLYLGNGNQEAKSTRKKKGKQR